MNEKVLKTLEYNKITDILAGYASSQAGAEECRKIKPLTDIEEIRLLQEETSDMVSRLRKKPAPHLSGLKNIIPALKRLEIGGILSCSDLLDISAVLDAAASVQSFLRPENDEEEPDSLTHFYEQTDPCRSLNDEIKRCITGLDEIADDASAALKDIRRHINQTNLQIQRTLSTIVTSQSMKTYLQDAVVTQRNGRYCIPVKLEHKNHVPGMVHDQSGSGSTVFIEPMAVVRLNNELKELALAEEKEISVILSKLSLSAGIETVPLEADCRLLVIIDVILAKARYSESIRGSSPEFNENGCIDLRQARHPLLDAATAVPINISLGKDFQMLIVTGPNTGGKTVSLKTAGLLCLMGQAGLHIPALDGSSLCIFNEIYADIGDEQSIEQSLSTFSSHMTNIVRILDKADSESLVLLDELCSGTDPTEGAALAQSILTRLHQFGARCMATTHYSELKVFAMSTPGVQNACCEFDVESLRPTYRLLIGLPGKSNAFAISEKLGLDTRLIADAKARIDSENIAFEDVLADIEINKKTAAIEREEAEKLMNEAKAQKEKLDREKAALEEKRDKIINDARSQAADLLQQAKDYADLAIKDIRKTSKTTGISALEKTRAEVGKKAREARENSGIKTSKEKQPSKTLTEADITEGLTVFIRSMNMKGVVTAGCDPSKKVGVRIGGMNMKVPLSDLSPAQEDASETSGRRKIQKTGIGDIQYSKALGISGELKLLGLTTDDALLELDKYLDDAQMAHLSPVRIVHGKGTGALRQAVQSYLRRDRRVKSFRLAEYGEGDSGVTIVELKK
mgnify:FL=1